MILEPGSKVLVSHRRLFEGDHGRYFVGTVDGYDNGIASITGYTWIRDGYQGHYTRKADVRTKIISLSSGTVIVYRLSDAVRIPDVEVVCSHTTVVLQDPSGFSMDLTECVLHAGDAPLRRGA